MIEASRRRHITWEEYVISCEISRAFEKLVEILNHAHRSLERLKSVGIFFGTLYIAANILCFSAQAHATQDVIVFILDLMLMLSLWSSHGDRNYNMWHVPTIMGFIRSQTQIRQKLLSQRG